MTHHPASHVPTGVSTELHIELPRPGVRHPPRHGASVGFAAVLLAALGVDMPEGVLQDSQRRDAAPVALVQADAASPPQTVASLHEWDQWKPMRDVA